MVKKNGNNADLINKHIKDLSVLLQTLWLRQTANTSMFFRQKLTKVEPNIHIVLKCGLPKQFKKAVNGETRKIRQQLTEAHQEAFARWQKSSQSKDPPTVDINHWLKLARRMKILNIFSRLSSLAATAELTLTVKENVSRSWMKNMTG